MFQHFPFVAQCCNWVKIFRINYYFCSTQREHLIHNAMVFFCNTGTSRVQASLRWRYKSRAVQHVNELYIYTKFYQGMSTMSDPVVDYSHVRGWSFPRGLSWCYKPVLYHHKHKSTADKALINVHFFLYFSYAMRFCFLIAPLHWDLWGGCFCAADTYHISGVIPSNFQYENLFQSKLITVHWPM